MFCDACCNTVQDLRGIKVKMLYCSNGVCVQLRAFRVLTLLVRSAETVYRFQAVRRKARGIT